MIETRLGCAASARRWLLILAFLGLVGGAAAESDALVEKGQAAFEKGAFSQAATDWSAALENFRRDGRTNAEIATSASLAAALQSIGQQRRAVQVLEEALDRANRLGDRSRVTQIKGRLGAALVLTLRLERADTLLQEALEAARADKDVASEAAILNDLGTLRVVDQKQAEALAAFEECIALARRTGDSQLLARALGNAAATASRTGDQRKADALNAEAIQQAEGLPPSYASAFLFLAAGQTDRLIKFTETEASTRIALRAHKSFLRGLEIGEKLDDAAIQTYALGYLGQHYEQDGQADAALGLTRRAIFAAQKGQMPEALYRWEWQLGRLLRARGETEAATAAYRRAVQTLQPIRSDVSLGYGNAATRLPFRESEGPLFFELADLLLQQATPTTDPKITRELLLEARDAVEQLKAVELEDYFRDDCVNIQRSKTRALEAVDEHTAVVYLIPLPTRTEMLVGLTSGLHRFTLDISAGTLSAEVGLFRRNLETRTTYEYRDEAKQLYDWIIRPIRGLLVENHIDTLVFVPDGALRTIPLASLHDGERFLVQEFAVAVAPGLSLVEPHPIERERVRVLLNGLSVSSQGYPALYSVADELDSIEPMYRGKRLLNEGFTRSEFERRMSGEQYSIVHIASHGQFDRDVRKTFVLTYDKKLTLNDLEALIRPSQYRGKPVEMLVLSACQTASGDDRAALGLAGVAVKAGARSALATLWSVNDESTSVLISELYGQMRHAPAVSKARALQSAQVKLIEDRRYRHPCYWSPYLIIGNWL